MKCQVYCQCCQINIDRTGVIEKYKSEAQYNLLNWQKCSNEMIELYNKYQKLADEYKELKERMECKEKL